MPTSHSGILQDLLCAFERQTGMRMSFEDLTGCLNGVHRDVPAMELDWNHQFHTCALCKLAKTNEAGHRDCIRNKLVANRLVIQRRTGLHGLCHLGLFDLAEPLIYHERVLGVFYFGCVVLRGTEALIRQRITRYCAKRKLDLEPFLEIIASLPVIEPESIPGHQENLRAVARIAQFFYQTGGVRPELYRFRALTVPYLDPKDVPAVVKETLHYICTHLNEPFIVKDLATRMHCHPDFLSRKFKQHVGIDLSLYLQQLRVERAKVLLKNPKLSIDDAAEEAGFTDRVHFGKVFRRVTGMPPGEFRKQIMQSDA